MYSAVILARSKSDFPNIREEYQNVVSKIKPDNKDMDEFMSHADSYVESFTRQIAGNPNNSGLNVFVTALLIFVFFFMLLPTINLVNINVSRIMERSSEIGVRKAFGASSRTLVGQFIIENLILTFLGTVIGVILSFFVLQFINNSGLIPDIHLTINFTVLAYSLLACIVFGLLSGVLPAWRMSKLKIVTALKAI
jgi:putative ABC transport system permease protein